MGGAIAGVGGAADVGGATGEAITGSESPTAMIIIGRMIAMLSSVTIGARSCTGGAGAGVGAACCAAGVWGAAAPEDGGASTAGSGIEAGLEVDSATGATGGGAGVVVGTASSGIFSVRLDRRREAFVPLFESRVVPVASGVSMSGIGGGPSPMVVGSAAAGGGPDEAARGRGGAGGAESGPRELAGAKPGLSDEPLSAPWTGEAGRCANPIAESSASSEGGASAEGDSVGISSTGGAAAP